MTETQQPGTRPRVEGDREDQILEATLDVLIELGYDRLTLDAVAKAAKASKATLYRRWESKSALVLDALLRAKGAPTAEVVDTGSLRGDLIQTFCGHTGSTGPAGMRVLGAVITGLNGDPEFARLFRDRFIAPKVALSHEIYSRAAARGEIREDLDLEVVAPSLAGILMHRSFVLGLPVTDDIVERVIDHVILPAVHPVGGRSLPRHPDNPAVTTRSGTTHPRKTN